MTFYALIAPLCRDLAVVSTRAPSSRKGATVAAPAPRVPDVINARLSWSLITAGRLTHVLDDWTPPIADLSLYYPGRRNPSAALKAFVGLARELSK